MTEHQPGTDGQTGRIAAFLDRWGTVAIPGASLFVVLIGLFILTSGAGGPKTGSPAPGRQTAAPVVDVAASARAAADGFFLDRVTEAAALSSDVAALKGDIRRLRRTVRALNLKLVAARLQRSGQQRTLVSRARRMAALTEKLDAAQKEIGRLRREADRQRTESAELRTAVAALTRDLAALRKIRAAARPAAEQKGSEKGGGAESPVNLPPAPRAFQRRCNAIVVARLQKSVARFKPSDDFKAQLRTASVGACTCIATKVHVSQLLTADDKARVWAIKRFDRSDRPDLPKAAAAAYRQIGRVCAAGVTGLIRSFVQQIRSNRPTGE